MMGENVVVHAFEAQRNEDAVHGPRDRAPHRCGFCYLPNENSAVWVVPSVSRTVRVPHFPAHDFTVFHT